MTAWRAFLVMCATTTLALLLFFGCAIMVGFVLHWLGYW